MPADCTPGSEGCVARDRAVGQELLDNPDFTGPDPQGTWTWSLWQDKSAVLTFGNPAGVIVSTKKRKSPPEFHDIQLNRNIRLDLVNGSTFEVCVQAGATVEGAALRFSVDSGPPDYSVPGLLERLKMDLPVAKLSDSCFRFNVDQYSKEFVGRIALEIGNNTGDISICQVSLRQCMTTEYISDAVVPVRRCYIAPLVAGASAGGCIRAYVFQGPDFQLNEFGQETDAKRICLQKTRQFRGNSFVFTVGRCEVWTCPTREALMASATGDESIGAAVYSELCEYQEAYGGREGKQLRAPVFVKLWEWNFQDVARECVEFLAPNGFDAVQVAPVTEHVVGGAWFAKYQVVSFNLNSRSGTAEDFKCMVATCRAAGVEVIVDVVLNHIAKPCDAVREVGADAVTPCIGWDNSRYGNRRLSASGGWPGVGPEDFHHFSNNRLMNCAVETGTFACPESTPPGDCTQCDLFGLPDWSTNLPGVQGLLGKHLQELHSIGVSMIRIDAASYINAEELSIIINQMPWDYVFQEWWAGIPEITRTRYVGNYRDIHYSRKITKVLAVDDVSNMPALLNITFGLEGMLPDHALFPLTFHDQRTLDADPAIPTYKNGLAFHQQQKFLLASPAGVVVRLWGGFGWTNLDDGPPGCRKADLRCHPLPVFDDEGETRCMPTPVRTPLDKGLANTHRWACEHRWTGTAGLIHFRKACRDLNVTETWTDGVPKGNFAFRTGDTCFVAVQRKLPPFEQRKGAWSLAGLRIGLPPGRYCDVASLPTRKGWDGSSCPREVVIGNSGAIVSGAVPEGDLTAIHAGMRLPYAVGPPLQMKKIVRSAHDACVVGKQLSGAGVARLGFWSLAAAAFMALVPQHLVACCA